MGASLTCYESSNWDSHLNVSKPYAPADDGKVTHDMTGPLSHYFVSSGHNSYLTSDQLVGDAGVTTIIECLKASCRVIELDVYNAVKKEEGPVCKHGGTFTKPVSARACIQAIKQYGFQKSPYPIIVTIESHINADNQLAFVDILKSELGDMLFIPPPGTITTWASPEELKKKVLIRANTNKAIPELQALVYIANSKFKTYTEMNAKEEVTSSSIGESKMMKLSAPFVKALATPAAIAAITRTQSGSFITRGATAEAEQEEKRFQKALEEARTKSQKEGKQLVLDDDDEEGVGADLQGIAALKDVYEYAARHLMRVYPAGWRVHSSNADPCRAWIMGASFAALNWQYWDKPLWTNEGKFMDNGGCGYVRKPDWMINPHPDGLPSRVPRTLAVTVYSAHKPQGWSCLCAKDDLFVQVEIKGMPQDFCKQVTHTAQDSGRLVVDTMYEFKIMFPEMAVLMFQLKDEDVDTDDVLGYCAMSVANLATGEFKLNLKNHHKKVLPDTWLKVKLEWLDKAGKAAPRSDGAATTATAATAAVTANSSTPNPLANIPVSTPAPGTKN